MASNEVATFRPKVQRNFADPDARIMKTADGSFHYCYNAPDHCQTPRPHRVRRLVDAGYFSSDNRRRDW